ncbi:DUF4123 domain-containing protein [Sphingomonas sp. 1P06PA]|uniref:DUF4123 domain-containing protein n=1 Tax=Sphingomonas sp. 1P06PA TaxID=554121 RepID=UPI0039A6373E
MQRQQVYGILDCARSPGLYPLIRELDPLDAPCLFTGDIGEDMRRVSPFIFALAAAPKIADIWGAQGLGRSWGIFLTSPMGLDAVRRHIRHFLQVRLPDGVGPVLFRMWDPRVLHPFLGATPPDQLEQMFAKVSSFVIETEAGLERQIYAGGGLRRMPAQWGALGG